MRALPDRNVIDVEVRRGHLPSQWPLLVRDWITRGSDRIVWHRALFYEALSLLTCIGVMLLGVTLTVEGEGALLKNVGAGVGLLAFLLYVSFGQSVSLKAPIGLFWVSALIERATGGSVQAGYGGHTRRQSPPSSPQAPSPSPEALQTATGDAALRAAIAEEIRLLRSGD